MGKKKHLYRLKFSLPGKNKITVIVPVNSLLAAKEIRRQLTPPEGPMTYSMFELTDFDKPIEF
jgi:hypothetical protein